MPPEQVVRNVTSQEKRQLYQPQPCRACHSSPPMPTTSLASNRVSKQVSGHLADHICSLPQCQLVWAGCMGPRLAVTDCIPPQVLTRAAIIGDLVEWVQASFQDFPRIGEVGIGCVFVGFTTTRLVIRFTLIHFFVFCSYYIIAVPSKVTFLTFCSSVQEVQCTYVIWCAFYSAYVFSFGGFLK